MPSGRRPTGCCCGRSRAPKTARATPRFECKVPCTIASELAHVRPRAVTLVATSWLSKEITGARGIEYVVDELEQHAQLARETAEGGRPEFIVDPRQQ